MRNLFSFVIIIAAFTLAIPALSAAQSCQMYTYSDFYVDGSGNAVGINYTDATGTCGDYTAYADVTLTVPSGSSVSASATAGCCAQAVAAASTVGQTGDGSLAGNNEVILACNMFSGGTFAPITIGGAYTKEVWIGGQLNGWCAVTRACYNTATPQCYSTAISVGQNGSCSPAWDTYFLTYQIGLGPVHCVGIGMSLPTSNTSEEWCTPAQ